nr:energy transducer TonB [Nitrospirota bacterium]
MTEFSLHRPGEVQARAWSWTVSLLLHGFAIGAAIILVADLRLAPQPEPFRWVVSKVEPRTPVEAPSQAQPAQAQPSKPMPPTQARPVEADATPTQPVPAIRQQSAQAAVAKPVEPTPAAREAITQQGPASSEPIATPVAPPTPAPSTHSAAASVMANAPSAQPQTAIQTQSVHSDPQAQAQDIPAPQAPPATVASLMPATQPGPQAQPTQATQTKSDYGWLGQMLRTRVEQLKHYPHVARANRWEGRVVLRAVIGEDGQLVDLKVSESSGHSILDEAAMEVLKKAAPLTLPEPLGRPQVVVQVPISYRLH